GALPSDGVAGHISRPGVVEGPGARSGGVAREASLVRAGPGWEICGLRGVLGLIRLKGLAPCRHRGTIHWLVKEPLNSIDRYSRIRARLLFILAFLMGWLLPQANTVGAERASDAGSGPRLTVTNLTRVFHNGEHNAFTDLIRFRDRFYLAFRSCPDGHSVHPTASIIVLSSANGMEWQQVHRFSVKHRDTRDPHFLVFKDRLFVYTGMWYTGPTAPAATILIRALWSWGPTAL
ncbi:MAG: hypothetical protein QHJ82_10750, partial [Verrucomicrobiota bacterium]|nr:hypothetical protein [Verrucomicrobiota bacterium]